MGAGLTNTTSLNDLIGTIVASEAQAYAYAARVMRPLVKWKEVPQGFNSVVIPRFQAVTVAALTEATAPTEQQMATDGVTLTPVERGALALISKTALRADPFDDLDPYAMELGRALAADEDALILDAFDGSVIVNEQSGSASNVTLDDMLTAISTLEAANAPGPYFGIWHPTSWGKLRKELDDASQFASVGRTVVEGFGTGFTSLNGYVGAPYGIPCFLSTGVNTKDTGATYDNYVFSREAAGYAYTKDIGVDVDENVRARAFDLMAWYSGDADELVDAYYVCVEDDVDG